MLTPALKGITLFLLRGGLLLAALGGTPAWAANLTVSNLNDGGAGSLRQAILDANAAAGADTNANPFCDEESSQNCSSAGGAILNDGTLLAAATARRLTPSRRR